MAKCDICGGNCGFLNRFHFYNDAQKMLENNGIVVPGTTMHNRLIDGKARQFNYEHKPLTSGTYLAEKLYSRIVEKQMDDFCIDCIKFLSTFAFCDAPKHYVNHLLMSAGDAEFTILGRFFDKCDQISDDVLRELANEYKVYWNKLMNSSTTEALLIECDNVISCMKNNISEIRKDYYDAFACGKCEEILKNDTTLAFLPISSKEIDNIHSSLVFSINSSKTKSEQVRLARTLQEVKVNIEVETINISNILYFEEKGDLSHVSQVSGGGSRDVNFGGAIIGDLLFGSTGALIGSRVGTGTAPITTSVKQIDNRYVSMLLKKDDGEIESKTFPYTYYDAFMKFIPEKEKGFIGISSNTQVQEKNTNNFDEIKKFKELFDMGIITEKEFQEKKKELLGL